MADLKNISKLGQSIWYDYIRRQFVTKGELKNLIDIGLRGVTSNPSIFEKAISGSNDYDADLKQLVNKKLSVKEIYERLALKDIELACDLMLPVYNKTKGLDGYVSIEVSPKLAYNTIGTIKEGKRLFAKLNKPNVMIKVPATKEGLPAITELIASGINVNVTLLFSIENYVQVAEAYIDGLQLLKERGGDLKSVSSVASFFLSRIDASVDKQLEKMGNKKLQGKIAIASAKVAYYKFNKIFSGKRWQSLQKDGAKVQRLLWASTSVKNPSYPDTLYVDSLIGKDTVNTVPPATFNQFLHHGIQDSTLSRGLNQAKKYLAQLKKLNIDLDKITTELQLAGVASFSLAFESLMKSIKQKMKKIKQQEESFHIFLNRFNKEYNELLNELKNKRIVERIWAKDFKVWGKKPDEISNRLGWLNSPASSLNQLEEINSFVQTVKSEGFKYVLLLGMGGSSLAPQVFSFTFGSKKGFPKLYVLDSTEPGAVYKYKQKLDPEKTLYIVSTKSGGTAETISFMKFFYNNLFKMHGAKNTGKHFVAITDPGSGLQKLAEELKFKKIFLNDPNIGGRYSALSLFGIVPAALIGVDAKKLLEHAEVMVCNAEGSNCPISGDNSAAKIGVLMGLLAKKGVDKITFIANGKLIYFGAWVEQLIAESTGKLRKGILPVNEEQILSPEFYDRDRYFVHLKLKGKSSNDSKVNALIKAGFPVVQIVLNDIYELGGEFFRWEMATAIAGWALGIQPFDQPNVEAAKILARKMISEYQKTGSLPEEKFVVKENDITVFGKVNGTSLKTCLNNFFKNFNKKIKPSSPRSYIALQAYLQPDNSTTKLLEEFRLLLQKKFKAATTLGYGPRFLHSTGQLHKGDAGKGLFIQFTSKMPKDLPIPDNANSNKSSISFGVLISAQALGDKKALEENKRKVIRIDLGNNIYKNLKLLIDLVK